MLHLEKATVDNDESTIDEMLHHDLVSVSSRWAAELEGSLERFLLSVAQELFLRRYIFATGSIRCNFLKPSAFFLLSGRTCCVFCFLMDSKADVEKNGDEVCEYHSAKGRRTSITPG